MDPQSGLPQGPSQQRRESRQQRLIRHERPVRRLFRWLRYCMFMAALVQISAVTMAPDASWAVSVAADGTVRTWGSGAPSVIRQTAPVDVGQPVAVALSAEHLRVLWAAEATIRRYEAPPRDDTFPAAARVRALALSPSGRLAVVAGDDATLRTVNADTG